ncbi:MAG: YceD family protein [Actinomycetaceae bacterium]|nr:YceD family protein [Actinomycetaceae bacterium]
MRDFVVNLHDLPRQEGAHIHIERDVEAPGDMRVGMIGVKPGSQLHLDVDLTSASEGVYVSGTVTGQIQGECARCLSDISYSDTQPLGELAYYPERLKAILADDEENDPSDYAHISGETVDVEPMVRDALLVALPLTPLCQPECKGLCPVCGLRLDDLPADHHHAATPAAGDDIFSELERALLADSAPESVGSPQSASTEPRAQRRQHQQEQYVHGSAQEGDQQ